jgi:aspartate-semialdehyde dehydrogenase
VAPVAPLLAPRAVHVTTYQSLSGAGYPGVSGLAITDNVVPYIAREEEKIAEETSKMLGAYRSRRVVPWGVPILAHCARVATREGHLEAVTIDATRRPSLAALRSAWTGFDPLGGRPLPTAPHPPIVVRSEPDRPQPLRDRWAGHPARARGMAVTVGRVRWNPPYLRFFLLSHNAIRGAAGASVLNAECAALDGLLPGVAEVPP